MVRTPGNNRVDVSLAVGQSGERLVGPGLPAWMRQCSWREFAGAEFVDYLHSTSGVPGQVTSAADNDETWMVVLCPTGPAADLAAGDRWGFPITNILEAWPVGAAPPQRFLDWIIARSYASVELPVQTGDSAPAGDDTAPLITQLPTWLWIDATVWQPVSVTPPPVFGITATVTATPYRVVFTNGNDTIDCGPNLGPAYNFTLKEAQQHSDCTLTYRHSSAVRDWTLTSTISWRITYACSAFCGSGTLPDLTIENTRDVTVAEIQAVLIPPTQAALGN